MRSDFIGDCMAYTGLPEAVNGGQYLVPRLTRDELRSAISGPVAVGGGTITQRLILRLLNDFGDEYDQLPILQHALMRTWDFWEKSSTGDPIDIGDYEAIGTVKNALSLHAEEAYEDTGTDAQKKIAEKMFKALTDTFSDPRGTRRPTSVADLAAICETGIEEIVRIAEIFRGQGRSFLMPPSDVPLEEFCIIDLSHESLMRCWSRLSAMGRSGAHLCGHLCQTLRRRDLVLRGKNQAFGAILNWSLHRSGSLRISPPPHGRNVTTLVSRR